MKLLSIFFILFSLGCSSMAFKKLEHEAQVPKIGDELSIGVGQDFFSWERMLGTYNIDGSIMQGSADKFDLKIRSASNNKVVLDYSEYYKSPLNGSGTYDKDGSWLIKPAFNKTLEFDLSSTKKIVYEKFEFEVSKVEPNKITYKRIK